MRIAKPLITRQTVTQRSIKQQPIASAYGFSLVELSIAVLLASGLIAGVVSHYTTLVHSSRIALLTVTMQMEALKINRQLNAFLSQQTARRLSISQYSDESANSCIVMRADEQTLHNDSTGFRLRDKAIELQMSGKSCDQSGWQDMISIRPFYCQSLVFTMLPTSLPTELVLQVHYTLVATGLPSIQHHQTLEYRL